MKMGIHTVSQLSSKQQSSDNVCIGAKTDRNGNRMHVRSSMQWDTLSDRLFFFQKTKSAMRAWGQKIDRRLICNGIPPKTRLDDYECGVGIFRATMLAGYQSQRYCNSNRRTPEETVLDPYPRKQS